MLALKNNFLQRQSWVYCLLHYGRTLPWGSPLGRVMLQHCGIVRHNETGVEVGFLCWSKCGNKQPALILKKFCFWHNRIWIRRCYLKALLIGVSMASCVEKLNHYAVCLPENNVTLYIKYTKKLLKYFLKINKNGKIKIINCLLIGKHF